MDKILINNIKHIDKNISGIYAITNIKSNKKYIGGSVNIRYRIRSHYSYLKNNKHNNIYLQRTFNKYGFDIFRIEILAICPKDWFYINKLENYFIKTLKPDYNLTADTNNKAHSKLTKKKLSEKAKLRANQLSQEVRSNPFKSYMKEIKSYNMLTKEVSYYDSIAQASRSLNICDQAIRSCLKGRIKRTNNLLWFYSNQEIKVQKIYRYVPIEQLDLNNNLIKIYESQSSAAKELKIHVSNIGACLYEKYSQKTAKGFVFKEHVYYNIIDESK